jgi:hypothetical protein
MKIFEEKKKGPGQRPAPGGRRRLKGELGCGLGVHVEHRVAEGEDPGSDYSGNTSD